MRHKPHRRQLPANPPPPPPPNRASTLIADAMERQAQRDAAETRLQGAIAARRTAAATREAA